MLSFEPFLVKTCLLYWLINRCNVLDCSIIYINDDILTQESFVTQFSSHCYVRFSHKHLPINISLVLVYQELSPTQFPLKWPHFKSNLHYLCVDCGCIRIIKSIAYSFPYGYHCFIIGIDKKVTHDNDPTKSLKLGCSFEFRSWDLQSTRLGFLCNDFLFHGL